ncbi:MAG: hypothetical protein DSZ08_04850 [Sulfurovum sp.]|nr:MAG: hypothetical protein DSZ08_04850 [Sulfurovum sp.]
MLRDERYAVNFVGSRQAGSAIVPHFDVDNEGYPGWTSRQIADHVYGFLQANQPDIILLHIGSNDWSDNVNNINRILDNIDTYERHYNHHIKVILARIINRQQYQAWITTLNRRIQSIANNRNAHGDDIYVVDMEYGAGLNYHTDFQDRTHPNNTGYYKMASVWFRALKRFLPSPIPLEPKNLRVTSVGTTSATISWTDTSNNEQGFRIYYGNKLVATLGANTTSYTIHDLNPNERYKYTVVSYSSGGNSNNRYIFVKTKGDYAWLIAVRHNILY